MEQLTSDLRGVAVYLDDILVSGNNAEEHVQNLQALFQRLSEKGLRCKLEKCSFAQPSVEYLGHVLSHHGVSKGSKVDAVMKMPPPSNVSRLRSFLGSVQFYSKFIPNLSVLAEPLTRLTRKDVPWAWTAKEQASFQALKDSLCTDAVLAHFDPSQQIGVSCEASDVGIGAVLFHRYVDGSERPTANASKTLTDAKRLYSQVEKEALAVIFALKKFHQFLYGRHFILVTDHKPLVTLFGPTKGTPALAANRLARWALVLNQYDYSIEYRKTAEHSNADALSRLPAEDDPEFDEGKRRLM
uniref:Reverse transcriptase domain-containing protein n=1 Tax=Trichuris muris TaxID=70415 RepID=A0A5S6QTD8_TRIMR